MAKKGKRVGIVEAVEWVAAHCERVAEKAHGDRVIAASLAWLVCDVEPMLDNEDPEDVAPPPGSMAERLREHDEKMGALGDPWSEAGVDIFAREGVHCGTDEWG